MKTITEIIGGAQGYHIVWIPKCRQKKLYGGVAKYLGKVFHELARQRESRILEGHLCPDHVHMLIEIPPKYAVSAVVGYISRNKRTKTNGRINWKCSKITNHNLRL